MQCYKYSCAAYDCFCAPQVSSVGKWPGNRWTYSCCISYRNLQQADDDSQAWVQRTLEKREETVYLESLCSDWSGGTLYWESLFSDWSGGTEHRKAGQVPWVAEQQVVWWETCGTGYRWLSRGCCVSPWEESPWRWRCCPDSAVWCRLLADSSCCSDPTTTSSALLHHMCFIVTQNTNRGAFIQ